MTPLLWVLLASLSMAGGSFLFGSIPLAISLSGDSLRLLSTFGSGLLVGTALIVILPEGVETLYAVQFAANAGNTINKATADKHGIDTINNPSYIDSSISQDEPMGHSHSHEGPHDGHSHRRRAPPPSPDEIPPDHPNKDKPTDIPQGHENHTHEHTEQDMQGYIGPSLVFGFLFMLLIDQMGHGGSSSSSTVSHIAISDFGGSLGVGGSSDISISGEASLLDEARYKAARHGTISKGGKSSVTLGLIVHAAADGIALGAAAVTDQGGLGLIVFLAILLHKAPAAFGLVTHLLSEGASKRKIRHHLFAFSFAAPLAAIITFCILSQVGWQDALVMKKWTGIVLLFSAGTFLYVATVHILPEIYSTGNGGGASGSHGHSHGHGHGGGGGEKTLSRSQIAVLVVGMFLPYFLLIEHSH